MKWTVGALLLAVTTVVTLPGCATVAAFEQQHPDIDVEYVKGAVSFEEGSVQTLPLGLVQFQGQYSADSGALFAGIVLAMIPSVLVYVVLQRSFTRGLVAGALR